jgi:Holliday junction resolvase RusA-like endonuclease
MELADDSPVIIELAGLPRAKGRPRFNRAGHAYTPERTKRYERDLGWMARQAMISRHPFEEPLQLEIIVTLAVPRSWNKARRERALAQQIRPVGKPDIDNLLKSIDALNQIVWLDDSQIVQARITKIYGAKPSFWIKVMIARSLGAKEQITDDHA